MPKRIPQPRKRDLFGDVIITRFDVEAWLVAVPRMTPGTPQAKRYVELYDVIGKIKAAKLAGTFDKLVAPAASPPEFWKSRFTWR